MMAAQQHGRVSRVTGEREVIDRLAAAKPSERVALLKQILRKQVSLVLRIPDGDIDVKAPLTSLGMDSLMGLELRNRIESVLGVKVSATLLWTYPTVEALSSSLADERNEATARESPEAQSEVVDVENMSAEALEQHLDQKLKVFE